MNTQQHTMAWAIFLSLSMPLAVNADDGHDHVPAAVAGRAPLPRFALVSSTYELVGELAGRQLTLYLDRYDDGAPVVQAQLNLRLGGEAIPVANGHEAGEFEAVLPRPVAPGTIPVSVAVAAAGRVEALAGELIVADGAAEASSAIAGGHERASGGEAAPRLRWAGLIGAAALLFLILGWRFWRSAGNSGTEGRP